MHTLNTWSFRFSFHHHHPARLQMLNEYLLKVVWLCGGCGNLIKQFLIASAFDECCCFLQLLIGLFFLTILWHLGGGCCGDSFYCVLLSSRRSSRWQRVMVPSKYQLCKWAGIYVNVEESGIGLLVFSLLPRAADGSNKMAPAAKDGTFLTLTALLPIRGLVSTSLSQQAQIHWTAWGNQK